MKSELELNHPTITNFGSTYLGDSCHCIFKTTVEELVDWKDNTPVIDAQRRALTAALQELLKRKSGL